MIIAVNLGLITMSLLSPHPDQKQTRQRSNKTKMDFLREAFTPKTFNKMTFVVVLLWIFLGLAATGIFSEMEINEPRFDFDCDVKTGSDKGFIRRKCFDQYKEKINKLGIPPYAFIIVNFSSISIVSLIYSQYVKSTVNRLEGGHEDAEREQRNPRRRRRLFVTYLSQLAAKFALGIMFFVFWRPTYFIPRTFPQILPVVLKKVMIRGIDLRTRHNQHFTNVSVREQGIRISGSMLWQWLTAFLRFLLSWRLSGSYHELRKEEPLWTMESFMLIIWDRPRINNRKHLQEKYRKSSISKMFLQQLIRAKREKKCFWNT